VVDDESYQGLTVVINGKKLTKKQTREIVPLINSHHAGGMTNGQLLSTINKMYMTEGPEIDLGIPVKS
jgi:hypothetical protein